MPEGPELHLASRMVNRIGQCNIFSGKVVKSEANHKNPEIDWDEPAYRISAKSRGKEVKLILTAVPDVADSKADVKAKVKQSQKKKTLDILFRFGMSGVFKFAAVNNMHKHAHLNFFTKQGDMVLSFVDVRRFGRWEVGGDWGAQRGPCVLQQYELFRENVLNNLEDPAFNRPICEALLNQKYFNGIGNYLRAEILYRAGVRPFDQAREVLEPLRRQDELLAQAPKPNVKVEPVEVKTEPELMITEEKLNKIIKSEHPVKMEKSDILHLCAIVPNEVIQLDGGKGYVWEEGEKNEYAAFGEWLQCYFNPQMKCMVDSNKRTIWFSGDPGPMAPKQGIKRHTAKAEENVKKSTKTRGKVKELADHDYTPKVRSNKRTSHAAKDNGENDLPQPKQTKSKKSAKKAKSKAKEGSTGTTTAPVEQQI